MVQSDAVSKVTSFKAESVLQSSRNFKNFKAWNNVIVTPLHGDSDFLQCDLESRFEKEQKLSEWEAGESVLSVLSLRQIDCFCTWFVSFNVVKMSAGDEEGALDLLEDRAEQLHKLKKMKEASWNVSSHSTWVVISAFGLSFSDVNCLVMHMERNS